MQINNLHNQMALVPKLEIEHCLPQTLDVYLNAYLELEAYNKFVLLDKEVNLDDLNMGLRFEMKGLQQSNVYCFMNLSDEAKMNQHQNFLIALFIESMNMILDHLVLNISAATGLKTTKHLEDSHLLASKLPHNNLYHQALYKLITHEGEFDCHIFLPAQKVKL